MISTCAIGIDLGNGNCCVATCDDGKVTVLKNDLNQYRTPCYVAFAGESNITFSGRIEIGDTAKQQSSTKPENVIYDIQHLIGRTFDDPFLQEQIHILPFTVTDENEDNCPKIIVNEHSYNPEEISGMILKYIKKQCEKYLQRTVTDAVITVPAYFNEKQIRATKDAGSFAGLNVLDILKEPTVAAIAYNHHLQRTERESNDLRKKNILIFDLGAKNFHLTLITLRGNRIVIKAVDGDLNLGGHDFTNAMVDHCLKEFSKKHKLNLSECDATNKFILNKRMSRMRTECELKKIRLSSSAVVNITLECLYNNLDLNFRLARKTFESFNQPLFDKCIEKVNNILEVAQVKREDVHGVILVGGSTRIPKIVEMLKDYFGGNAVWYDIERTEVVAYGAAVQANLIILGKTAYCEIDKSRSSNKIQKNVTEDHVTNVHLELAKVLYEQEMEKQIASSKYILQNELHEKHLVAAKITLAKLYEIEKFSNGQNEKVKLYLNNLLPHYEEINAKKKIEGPAIGIDLGTTYSCVSIFRGGKSEVIPNELGKNKSPSYVTFPIDEDEEDDGDENRKEEIVCGQTAKELAHAYPLTTIFDIKRMIGRNFYDSRIQKDKMYWPFQIANKNEEIKIIIGKNAKKSPLELTAALLEHLKRTADVYLKAEVVKIVVSVPAYYTRIQLEIIKEACELAGLHLLQLVKEPIAAALAYSFERKKKKTQEESDEPRNCFIFDFGGGTLDVAVLTVRNKSIQVKAVHGDEHLGGQDFDKNMMKYCLDEFRMEHGVDLLEKMGSTDSNDERVKISTRLRRLMIECERYKCFLSQEQQSSVTVSLEAMYGSTPLVVKISKEVFNAINHELYAKCIDAVRKVLQDSGLKKEDIDDIVLVGGSCRVPEIQARLSRFFKRDTFYRSSDPDESVANGAAMLAYYADNPQLSDILIEE